MKDFRWPRWMAWLRAKLTGDPWIPCPVCKSGFAHFEAYEDGVDYKYNSGGWECRLVCLRPSCRAEARKQARAWYGAMDRESLTF